MQCAWFVAMQESRAGCFPFTLIACHLDRIKAHNFLCSAGGLSFFIWLPFSGIGNCSSSVLSGKQLNSTTSLGLTPSTILRYDQYLVLRHVSPGPECYSQPLLQHHLGASNRTPCPAISGTLVSTSRHRRRSSSVGVYLCGSPCPHSSGRHPCRALADSTGLVSRCYPFHNHNHHTSLCFNNVQSRGNPHVDSTATGHRRGQHGTSALSYRRGIQPSHPAGPCLYSLFSR